MSQWDEFVAAVGKGIAAAAKDDLAGYVNELTTDAQAFVTAARNDLETWTSELANGKIDEDDLTDYVRADAALATMAAITAAGIAAADLQRFRTAVIDTVISAAITTFKV